MKLDRVRKFLKENLILRSDYLNYAKTPFTFMVAYSLSKRQTSIFVFGAESNTMIVKNVMNQTQIIQVKHLIYSYKPIPWHYACTG